MISEQETRTGEGLGAGSHVLSEVREALHALGHSASESVLVQIARQKIERLEQGLSSNQDQVRVGRGLSITRVP